VGKYFTDMDFDKMFPNEDSCLQFLFEKRFGDGYHCPKCDHNKFYRVSGRKCYDCGHCGHQIYPMKGTILEGSTTSLLIWFKAIYEFHISRAGQSSKDIERRFGLTYKTAWRMTKLIRSLMTDDVKLEGKVEVDSTWVGGSKNSKKVVIFGMMERGKKGLAKFYIINNECETETLPLILKHIEKGSTIYTDQGGAFYHLSKHGYIHKTVNHRKREYVNGDKHTCTIDSFWGRFKCSITGTHRHISKKWAQGYIDEFCFRHNRNNDEEKIFLDLLNNVPTIK
jgi:transposase